MSWLLFYLLAALHPVAFIVIGLRSKTWRQRLLLWALLPLPAVLYCWDYYVIKNEHAQMCAAEGGLRVLIQPEKVDRVRLVGDHFRNESAPKSVLEQYYPQVSSVAALQTKEVGMDGKPLPYYVAYTAAPNPKASPTDKGPFQKEPTLIFQSQRIDVLDPNMFELTKVESDIAHGTKTEVILSKGDKVYAKHTTFVHWWTGIQYPDALPTWRCPDINKRIPPKDDPSAPLERWVPTPHAKEALLELILK